jgi:translation elongation factor EF-Ts
MDILTKQLATLVQYIGRKLKFRNFTRLQQQMLQCYTHPYKTVTIAATYCGSQYGSTKLNACS